MTFLPSHQLPSSGSNWMIFGLFLAVVLCACGSPRSAVKKRPEPRPEKHRIPVDQPKVDTIDWVLAEEVPPIDDETPAERDLFPATTLKDNYQVDLLIPLKSKYAVKMGEEWNVDAFQNRFINFYNGVRLAINDLGLEDINIDLIVHDTDYRSRNMEEAFATGAFRRSDLIVGPYSRDNVKWLSSRMKNSETSLISPWISSTSIADDNLYYVQVKPGLLTHYEKLLESAREHQDVDSVYLVIMEGDQSKLRYMGLAGESIGIDPERPFYQVLELNVDSLTYGKAGIDTTLFERSDCKNTFVVPYASNKDAVFVYDFLRKLQILGVDCECEVFGMYKWLDFQDQMFELINSMNVYLTVSNLVDLADVESKAFRQRYLSSFGAFPSSDAYEGYDLFMYIGRQLQAHGRNFQFAIKESSPFKGLQTEFRLTPIYGDDNRVDYFENRHIELITVENYQLVRIE